MITFYITSRFWEKSPIKFLDYPKMSEQDIADYISKNPDGIEIIEPSSFDCAFRSLFIAPNLNKDGFLDEGIYHAELNHAKIEFRVLCNINALYARKSIEE